MCISYFSAVAAGTLGVSGVTAWTFVAYDSGETSSSCSKWGIQWSWGFESFEEPIWTSQSIRWKGMYGLQLPTVMFVSWRWYILSYRNTFYI